MPMLNIQKTGIFYITSVN